MHFSPSRKKLFLSIFDTEPDAFFSIFYELFERLDMLKSCPNLAFRPALDLPALTDFDCSESGLLFWWSEELEG